MTKEDLEKEAKEYATENYEECMYDDVIGWTNDFEARKEAYIAGAEPREKRIEELERENELIKSFLYCTKRSCFNCGKVNCENFQRQRVDCCGHWVSFKDYIPELEKENAELKKFLFCKGECIEQTEQLTKAKGIIKYLLSFIQKENYRTRWDINITEAEQFISEVGND